MILRMAVVADTEQVVDSAGRLRQLLAERGMRQNFLAEKTGIHRSIISYLCSGSRRMTPAYAMRIGQFFGIDPRELVDPSCLEVTR